MRNFYRKHKWTIHWSILAAFLLSIILTAAFLGDNQWGGNILQTLGTITGFYLTLIIFLISKEDSDKQFKEHLEKLQELNQNQVLTLKESTERQIKTLQDLNNEHLKALQKSTDEQINNLQNLTERQIESIQKTTNEQISSFEKQIFEVTTRLSDNSVLLAEILGRELEKSIERYSAEIKNAESVYKNLSGFKLLSTPEEKEKQLNSQWNRIQAIKNGYDYLIDKYNKVKEFLGGTQKKISE